MTKEMDITDEQAEQALKNMLNPDNQDEVKSNEESLDNSKGKSTTETDTKKDEAGDNQEETPKKGNPNKRYEKLLKQRNTAREEAKAAKDELEKLKSGDYDEEKYSTELDADLAIVKKETETTYSDKRASELDQEYQDAFYEDVPEANEYREEINKILEDNPTLNLEQAYKLHLASNHPDKLYDIHNIRKAKSNNEMIGTADTGKQRAAGKITEKTSVEDLKNMPLDQLTSHLKEATSGGFNLFG